MMRLMLVFSKMCIVISIAFFPCIHYCNLTDEGDKNHCKMIWKEWEHGEVKEPVIFGEHFVVPQFKIKITETESKEPARSSIVHIMYYWEWFEYPYPEHPNGVFTEADDTFECITDSEGTISVPEYEVIPRGWYNGKKIRGLFVKRDPVFTEVRISVDGWVVWMTKHDIQRIKKGETGFFLTRPDKFLGKYQYKVSR